MASARTKASSSRRSAARSRMGNACSSASATTVPASMELACHRREGRFSTEWFGHPDERTQPAAVQSSAVPVVDGVPSAATSLRAVARMCVIISTDCPSASLSSAALAISADA